MSKQDYKINNSTLSVIFGNIREAAVDVIVTSDDSQLSMKGGTSKAIREAAGESIYNESRHLLPVPLGGVRSTSSGNLANRGVRYIFHAATIPSSNERKVDNQDAIVRDATRQSLEMLRSMKLKSIALPALGAGFADFDVLTVAIAMSEEIRDFLNKYSDTFQVEIRLLTGTKKDFETYEFLKEFTNRVQLPPERRHAVVLIHGIMTAAGWREQIVDELAKGDPSLYPILIGYGFFDIFRFLLPPIFPCRRNAAETVWKKLRIVIEDKNIDKVSIIAHSFGTWITGYLINSKDKKDTQNHRFYFHRVIFCGSIVDSEFDWGVVKTKIKNLGFSNAPSAIVVNDCGTNDIWPIFAKFMTWGYGPSGRWGFQHPLVKDRFHKKDHSEFFKKGFATKYWVPLLTNKGLTKGVNYGISPPWWLSILTILKLPYLLLLVAGLLVWFFR